jgi:hypothetical protein
VYEDSSNAKSTLQCPIEPDDYSIEQTVALPAEIPRGSSLFSLSFRSDDDVLTKRLRTQPSSRFPPAFSPRMRRPLPASTSGVRLSSSTSSSFHADRSSFHSQLPRPRPVTASSPLHPPSSPSALLPSSTVNSHPPPLPLLVSLLVTLYSLSSRYQAVLAVSDLLSFPCKPLLLPLFLVLTREESQGKQNGRGAISRLRLHTSRWCPTEEKERRWKRRGREEEGG